MIEFKWINNILTAIRLVIFSKWTRKKIKSKNKSDSVYILANGPSLTAEIDEAGSDFFVGRENLVVNYFVFSDVYEIIKPVHYVISAVELFQDVPPDTLLDKNIRLYKELQERTKWEMVLYVPMAGKKFKGWKKILENPNIKVHYYNTAVSEGSTWLINWMLKHQLGMPRLQNVLIAAITLSIVAGYKKIFLFGVDHSWLKEITVTNDNSVLINQPHFYDKDSKAEKMIKNHTETRKLHEVLYKFYCSFKAYFDLKRFAEKNGTQIFNLTELSQIDAFDRMTIEELKEKQKN